jgi:hypothetical protein
MKESRATLFAAAGFAVLAGSLVLSGAYTSNAGFVLYPKRPK